MENAAVSSLLVVRRLPLYMQGNQVFWKGELVSLLLKFSEKEHRKGSPLAKKPHGPFAFQWNRLKKRLTALHWLAGVLSTVNHQ